MFNRFERPVQLQVLWRRAAVSAAVLVMLCACTADNQVRTMSNPVDRERFCAEVSRLLPPGWLDNAAADNSGYNIDATAASMSGLVALAPPEVSEQAHTVAGHVTAVASTFHAFDADSPERWDPAPAQAALELVGGAQASRALGEIADYCN